MLIRPVLLAGAGIALALIAIGVALPCTLFRAFVALLFSLGLVLWIQGNFLVPDYGAFTGAAIDWSIESWRNPYEIALWIAVPLLARRCGEICRRVLRRSPAACSSRSRRQRSSCRSFGQIPPLGPMAGADRLRCSSSPERAT